ncbi:hypothetical protein [Cytobacillus sp. NCCP-133]|uniref:hypothetical protein n=1 Tax=Cytobacillus sp. NCCP-133 TaxID=766848 RepID=UPI00223057AE|nr:hypothetical protein [Cytobacillus sp. NCCP-133]
MNESRKQIIVNELLFWKKSRMLPDQYCDYLLALYTEGNQPKDTRKEKKGKTLLFINLFFLLLIPVSVFLIHFTELSIILQTVILFLFVFAGIFAVFYFSAKRLSYHIPIISAAFILLNGSVEFVSVKYGDIPLMLFCTLIINSLLWLAAGWKLRIHYFAVSSILGLIVIFISIFI